MADGEFDLFTGLIGVVLVTRKGMTGPDGMPKDVDKEVISFFVNFNEDESHMRNQNIKDLTPNCDEACHFQDEVPSSFTSVFWPHFHQAKTPPCDQARHLGVEVPDPVHHA
jgi:hypothetical protein